MIQKVFKLGLISVWLIIWIILMLFYFIWNNSWPIINDNRFIENVDRYTLLADKIINSNCEYIIDNPTSWDCEKLGIKYRDIIELWIYSIYKDKNQYLYFSIQDLYWNHSWTVYIYLPSVKWKFSWDIIYKEWWKLKD